MHIMVHYKKSYQPRLYHYEERGKWNLALPFLDGQYDCNRLSLWATIESRQK